MAGVNKIVRAGLRSARRLVTEWRGIVLDGHRLRDGSVKMDSETISDLAPWDRVLGRLDAADLALATKPPMPDRKTIQRGLQAALVLAQEHRAAIVSGFDDPETEPEKRYPECRRYLRPVDRTITKIQAALDTSAIIAPAPGVSKELRDLIAAVERAQAEHEAAADAHDAAWSEMNRRCPAPQFCGPIDLAMAQALAQDSELSDAERAEIRAYAAKRAEIEAALNMPALDDASRVTANAWTAAEAAVLHFPARSLPDCRAKLEYGLKVDYFGEGAGEPLQILAADLRCLAGA